MRLKAFQHNIASQICSYCSKSLSKLDWPSLIQNNIRTDQNSPITHRRESFSAPRQSDFCQSIHHHESISALRLRFATAPNSSVQLRPWQRQLLREFKTYLAFEELGYCRI